MSQQLKDVLKSLKKERDRLRLNPKQKGKPRNLKDGEETRPNMSRRGINKGLSLLNNSIFRQIVTAIVITKSTKGICPRCQDKPIDSSLLEILYFPFCKLCAKDFVKRPEDRDKFIDKTFKKLQKTK